MNIDETKLVRRGKNRNTVQIQDNYNTNQHRYFTLKGSTRKAKRERKESRKTIERKYEGSTKEVESK